jgi:putative hydrolase of the HAD superfamily
MKKWQAVIFDLDDTLYPEREYVFSGFRAVAKWSEENLNILSSKVFSELRLLFEAGVRGNTFNILAERYQWKQVDLIEQLVQIYRTHDPILSPFPEVIELLSSIRASCSLGLISDGLLFVQQKKLTALNLVHYFDAIVFSDELGKGFWKPNPKPFEVVLNKIEAEPFNAIYVADNPIKDFLGARRAGMFSVRVRRKGGLYSNLEPETSEHAPDFEITDLMQLQEALHRI